MDAKLRYKAKKIKIVFFDIDDTLRNSKTGFIPSSIPRLRNQMLRIISLGPSKKELSMAWLGVMMPSCLLVPI